MGFATQKICQLFGTKTPIVQGGMVWVSGGKLAAAVSEAGALGLIGAGSMKPDLLRHHIQKAKGLTQKPFGVNIPLLYTLSQEQIDVALAEGVKIFFTSAGSPKKYTEYLKSKGCVVVHVTSSPTLAVKCEEAGVDAVVAEGFEAGGHNGREELTTMALIPQVVASVKIPVIAAGGVANGRGIAAAFALGASGVQMGTRFVCTQESSAHDRFKQAILQSGPGDTALCMKALVPVRLLKNKFFQQVAEYESRCASKEDLSLLLGKGRAKLGMLDGELEEGELEIGQVSAMIRDIPTVAQLIETLKQEYQTAVSDLPSQI
jgi:enoyl-[acyl-carrier protein] reductase II